MNDLASEVRRRAAGLCEYCRLPEAAFKRPFHMEHIVAKQHGGPTQLDNLALACWECNLKKGPNLTGLDPKTNQITPLFNPRKDRWAEHFTFAVGGLVEIGIEIQGLTDIGRTTARVLGMNKEIRNRIRYDLWREGSTK